MQPFYAIIIPTGLLGAHPEHPIAPGGPPLGIWGPTDPRPTPPIHMPPGSNQPPTIWGPTDPRPTPPIVIPPDGPPPGEQPPTGPVGALEWHTVWTEQYGWAMVGVQTGDHVTPSHAKKGK